MKLFKKVVLGAAMALAFTGAHASLINVGGVSWDPDYTDGGVPATEFDFIGRTNFTQWFTNSSSQTLGAGANQTLGAALAATSPVVNPGVGGTSNATGLFLQGAGEFTQVNNPLTQFCPSCQLMYAFGGIGLNGDLSFNVANAWARAYVIPASPNFVTPYTTPAAWAAIQAGSVWLDLDVLDASFRPGSTLQFGFVDAHFEVIGGAAEGNFQPGILSYSAQAQFNNVGSVFSTGGTATVTGNSIPEPASLALVGLGLLGAGALRRRKAAK